MADDGNLAPHVRGVHFKITTLPGFTYYVTRASFRYLVTGRELYGPGDNATFLHDATEDFRKGPHPRLTRARWRRVARRWGLAAVPGGLLGMEGAATMAEWATGWFDAAPPGWAEVPYGEVLTGYLVTGPLLAGTILVPRVQEWYREREPRSEFIYPAGKVLAQITATKFNRRESVRQIILPPTFGQELEDGAAPDSVRVYLPQVALDPNVKKRIESNVGARLGMPGAVGTWHEAGGRAWVDLLPASLPPKTLSLADVEDAVSRSNLDQPVLGMANGRSLHVADFLNDSPHVAVSGGSGAGKSTLFRLMLSQRIRNGSGLIVLDFKKWSHEWARDMGSNRVIYAHRIRDIHNLCVGVGDELVRRIELNSREELDALRTVDVLVEEANSLVPLLRKFWTEERARIKAENKAALADDPGADVTEPPLHSPAILALEQLINMGRELHMHAHYAGQRLSATVFGPNGGDKRSSFQTRLLGRWDRAAWKMLAGDIPYVVCPGGPTGIWALIQGSQVTILRVPFLSHQEARTIALSGAEPTQAILGDAAIGEVLEGQATERARIPQQRVKLAEAVSRLPGPALSLDALRKASQREGFPAPVFPPAPGVAAVYDLAALVDWKERRNGCQIEGS